MCIRDRFYGMKYSWKGHKDRNWHKNSIKMSGQARLVLCQRHKLQHLHHVKMSERVNNNNNKNWLWNLVLRMSSQGGRDLPVFRHFTTKPWRPAGCRWRQSGFRFFRDKQWQVSCKALRETDLDIPEKKTNKKRDGESTGVWRKFIQ